MRDYFDPPTPTESLVVCVIFVVVPSLQYYEVVTIDEVDKAMFTVDSPRPAALEKVAEGLWFADPDEGFAQRVFM